jgi:hypothetical protein
MDRTVGDGVCVFEDIRNNFLDGIDGFRIYGDSDGFGSGFG